MRMNQRYRHIFISLLSLVVILGCSLAETLLAEEGSQPTAISHPKNTPIPGWEKFAGEGVELWLPESFEGGNLEEDINAIVENLKKLGPDFEP